MDEFYLRFSARKYDTTGWDPYVHLTNNAITKNWPEFKKDQNPANSVPNSGGPGMTRTQKWMVEEAKQGQAAKSEKEHVKFSECLLQNKPTPKQTFSTSKMFV